MKKVPVFDQKFFSEKDKEKINRKFMLNYHVKLYSKEYEKYKIGEVCITNYIKDWKGEFYFLNSANLNYPIDKFIYEECIANAIKQELMEE